MRFDVLTLFPAAFTGPMDESILGRARAAGHFDLHLHDIRDHATDRHRTVDDYPFGGGQGMLMRVDVLDQAVRHVQSLDGRPGKVIYLSPAGRRLDDRLVRELATEPRLVLVCGRYEGVDQRFVDHRVDLEISIGDYIVTGGELPAMVLIDAVARHVNGVLGDDMSPEEESFADGLLEHPHYTRPAEYEGWEVPPVLLGGDHARIEAWRREQRVTRTLERRPDMLPAAVAPSDAERHRVGVPGVRVRALDYPRDIPAVYALLQHSGIGSDLPPVVLATLHEAHPELLLVAEQANQLVAAALASSDGFRVMLLALVVSAEERSRGIGSALLRELERALTGRQRAVIVAAIPEGLEAAGAFLATLGWAPSTSTLWERRL